MRTQPKKNKMLENQDRRFILDLMTKGTSLFNHWEYSDYYLRLHCYIHNFSVDTPFDLLQVYDVEFGSLHRTLSSASRKPSVPGTLTTTNGQHSLLTIRPGATPSTCRLHLWGLRQNPTLDKRRKREIQGASASIPDQTFNCSRCSRTCLSCIGLVSHQHAYSLRGEPIS